MRWGFRPNPFPLIVCMVWENDGLPLRKIFLCKASKEDILMLISFFASRKDILMRKAFGIWEDNSLIEVALSLASRKDIRMLNWFYSWPM